MHTTWKQAAIAVIALGAVLSSACEVDQAAEAKARSESLVERGEYLVNISGCHDCHTPFHMGPNGPEPDMTKALSGHPSSFVITTQPTFEGPEWLWAGAPTNTAFAGPWGISFAANLTPDRNTGIGIWTKDQFTQTLRTGKHWGVDRPILPPMPWQAYSHMTDEDLEAVFAYLQSIEPMVNTVPPPVPPPAAQAVPAAGTVEAAPGETTSG